MTERNYVGWLSTSGEHFQCNSFGHDELTRKLIKDYFKSEEYMTPFESDDYLFDRGWCRISIVGMGNHGYHLQMKWIYATEQQKEFIRKMVSDIGSFLTERTKDNLKHYGILER